MKIGISTASLYPMHTESALLQVAELGLKNAEIFLNSTSELRGEVFSSIKRTAADYDMNIVSVHPFSSPMETLFLFSSYDRRVAEMLDMYERYFEAMEVLGAKIFVVHGAISSAKCSDERYVERFSQLAEIGRGHGVVVAQENVSYCRSGQLSFMEMLSQELGDNAAFVLDIKQARRSGYTAFDIIESVGDKIVHLHLSDGDGEYDCLPIGRGDFDFRGLFEELDRRGYSGDAVVELYRDNYGEYRELSDCVEKLRKLL